MRKLAIAIIAILFVSLAGCAATGVKGRSFNPDNEKAQHAWPDQIFAD